MRHGTTYDKDDGALVLKLDAKGRVRSTEQQRAAVLLEFKRSGLSGPRFAAVAGVNYQTLATSIGKARQQSKPDEASPAGSAKPNPNLPAAGISWVEAVVAAGQPSQQSQGLQVRLYGGAQMEITTLGQVALAAALLRAMEGGVPPC
jgi:hypothetical protein